MKISAYCTFLGLSLATLAGCDDKNKTAPEPSASSATATSAAPAASAAPSAKPVDPKIGAWSGAYTLAAAELSIPSDNKDYKGVKQAKDDPSKLMGDGKIDLTIDAEGKVAGTVEGAAGPAVIDGSVVGDEIRGNVRRKDPKDNGLTGTLFAKIAGGAAEGKLALSEGNAAIVREAKVELKKK